MGDVYAYEKDKKSEEIRFNNVKAIMDYIISPLRLGLKGKFEIISTNICLFIYNFCSSGRAPFTYEVLLFHGIHSEALALSAEGRPQVFTRQKDS